MKREQVNILTAGMSEYEEIRRFLNEHGRDLLQSGPLPELPRERRRDLFNKDATTIWLVRDAENGKELIAHLSIHWRQTMRRKVGTIENVLVHPKVRREGVGHMLMQHAIAHARTVGCDRLELVSELHRVRARALYEELGFRHVGNSDRHFQLDLK